MTVLEWFDALQWIHIVLIVTILLVFVGYIYLIKKVTQLEFVGGLVGKWKIRVFGILFGLLVVVYLFYNLYNIQPNGWVEISLLAGLVAATGALALVTLQQAHTSTKMAEEMRAQRYDTVRPVIDIERRPTELERAGVNINIADKRERFPDKLTCILRNIGVGPATDVYSFVQPGTQPDDKRPPYAFGTLAKNGETDEMPLSLKPRDNCKVLVAYYRDVYG